MRTIACWINCERLRIFRYLYNNSFLNLSLTNRLTPSRPSFSGTNVDETVDDDSLIVFKVGRRQALNSDDDQLVALYICNFHFFLNYIKMVQLFNCRVFVTHESYIISYSASIYTLENILVADLLKFYLNRYE